MHTAYDSALHCDVAAWLYTAAAVNMQEAQALGLVLDVVEPDQLMSAATDLARRIAGREGGTATEEPLQLKRRVFVCKQDPCVPSRLNSNLNLQA